ncbi:MAG: hypothetical protein AAFP86_19865 [Planctomycetota bacterium]
MAGRKLTDEAEALEALDAIARTGLELADWCRARDIDARSLVGWRGVLEARGYEPPVKRTQPDFVEVVRVPVERAARYTIRHREFTVEVDDDFDDQTLGRLLAVVGTC